VTQRGNCRADAFLEDGGREAYLRFLRAYGVRQGLSIWAYCLMTNPVHFVAVPAQDSSPSAGLRGARTVYYGVRSGIH